MTLYEVTPRGPTPGDWEGVGSYLLRCSPLTWYPFTPGVWTAGSVGVGGLGPDKDVRVVPFPVAQRTFFDMIGFHIATLDSVTPKNGMQVAIREDNGAGFPGEQIYDARLCEALNVGLNTEGIDLTLDGPAMYWAEIQYIGAENVAIVQSGLGPDTNQTGTSASFITGYMGLPCFTSGDAQATGWNTAGGIVEHRRMVYGMIRAGALEFQI